MGARVRQGSKYPLPFTLILANGRLLNKTV